eukprot:TRINITY_DN18947_c0_g1_i1.p1 TRINITY_DN18947_c0_g1~~TRINITY_DN18947_c0_g1_i1.p1  ORF type:complete len:999 (+),score=431.07 TRINITY_DN18947_c0_g1_i1:120-2999(+)
MAPLPRLTALATVWLALPLTKALRVDEDEAVNPLNEVVKADAARSKASYEEQVVKKEMSKAESAKRGDQKRLINARLDVQLKAAEKREAEEQAVELNANKEVADEQSDALAERLRMATEARDDELAGVAKSLLKQMKETSQSAAVDKAKASKAAKMALRSLTEAQSEEEKSEFEVEKDDGQLKVAGTRMTAAESKTQKEALNVIKAKAKYYEHEHKKAEDAVKLAAEQLQGYRRQAQALELQRGEHEYNLMKAKQDLEEVKEELASGKSGPELTKRRVKGKVTIIKERAADALALSKLEAMERARHLAEKALLDKVRIARDSYEEARTREGDVAAAETHDDSQEMRSAEVERRKAEEAVESAVAGQEKADEKALKANLELVTARNKLDAARSEASLDRSKAASEEDRGPDRVRAVRQSADSEAAVRKASMDLALVREAATKAESDARIQAIRQNGASAAITHALDKVGDLTKRQEEKDSEKEGKVEALLQRLHDEKAETEGQLAGVQQLLEEVKESRADAKGRIRVLRKNYKEDGALEAVARVENRTEIAEAAQQKRVKAELEEELAKGEERKALLEEQDREFDERRWERVLSEENGKQRASLGVLKAADAAAHSAQKEAKQEDVRNAEVAEDVARARFNASKEAILEAKESIDESEAAAERLESMEKSKKDIVATALRMVQDIDAQRKEKPGDADLKAKAANAQKVLDVARMEKAQTNAELAQADSATKMAQQEELRAQVASSNARKGLTAAEGKKTQRLSSLAEEDVNAAKRKKLECGSHAMLAKAQADKAVEESDRSFEAALKARVKEGFSEANRRHYERVEQEERLQEEMATGANDLRKQQVASTAKQHAREMVHENAVATAKEDATADTASSNTERHDKTFSEEMRRSALAAAEERSAIAEEIKARATLKDLEPRPPSLEAPGDEVDKPAKEEDAKTNTTDAAMTEAPPRPEQG